MVDFGHHKTIKFYEKDQPYYEFTNFYPVIIHLDGLIWLSSEHYFQAQKYNDPRTPRSLEYMSIIQQADTSYKAFLLGRKQKGHGRFILNKQQPFLINHIIDQFRDVPIRADWERVRIDVMYRILKAKFQQHPKLRRILLSTGDAEIIENSPRDSFWGVGPDGHGTNWLGRLLMELRRDLM